MITTSPSSDLVPDASRSADFSNHNNFLLFTSLTGENVPAYKERNHYLNERRPNIEIKHTGSGSLKMAVNVVFPSGRFHDVAALATHPRLIKTSLLHMVTIFVD